MQRALLLVCPDSPGILADVATWVASIQGNIVDAAQTNDAEHDVFIQRVEFDHNDALKELRQSFSPLSTRWSMRWELREPNPGARFGVLAAWEGHCLYDFLGRCASGDLNATIDSVISNRSEFSETAQRLPIPFHQFAWPPTPMRPGVARKPRSSIDRDSSSPISLSSHAATGFSRQPLLRNSEIEASPSTTRFSAHALGKMPIDRLGKAA